LFSSKTLHYQKKVFILNPDPLPIYATASTEAFSRNIGTGFKKIPLINLSEPLLGVFIFFAKNLGYHY